MHIDMNSCYASLEQQANPLLRGRPVAVCAYATYWGAIISPSIEAKQQGVKVGMSVRDAQKLCRDLFVVQMHPPLYLDAHMRFKRIFSDYSPAVWPKSVDEAVIDFSGTPALRAASLMTIGRQIKQRVKEEIGDWLKVNVGIGPNQFLAKLAAGFNKPDGLSAIDHLNLRSTYARLDLLELPGINVRNKMRLWLAGIRTPLDFLEAPLWQLKHQVFQSINGYYWYLRLRGWEVDALSGRWRRSYGNNNTLQIRTNDWQMLNKFVMKLCEKTGRRLRRGNFTAGRIQVWLVYEEGGWWHRSRKLSYRLYTSGQIFRAAMGLFRCQPMPERVPTHLGVEVSDLRAAQPEQLGLFSGNRGDDATLSRALDKINDRYGDLVVGSGLLAGMDNFILNRIAYGSIKDIQDLYE